MHAHNANKKSTSNIETMVNVTVMNAGWMYFIFFCSRKFHCRVLSPNSALSQVTYNGLTGFIFWRKRPSCLCDTGSFGKKYTPALY